MADLETVHATIDHTGITGVGGSAATFAGARVKRASGTVTLGNNTITPITFDAEDFDTDGFHSTASNTSRLTVPTGKAGKYLIGGSYYTTTADPADGIIRLNGTTVINFQRFAASSVLTSCIVSTIYALAEADYVELCGRTPTVSGTAAYDVGVSPIFWMYLIG